MSDTALELSRIVYAFLAFICTTGFVATLWIRWDLLQRGERILRAGLVSEHLVIVYGAYVALDHRYPGSITAPLLVLSMLVMVLGFGDWIVNDLIPRYRGIPASF